MHDRVHAHGTSTLGADLVIIDEEHVARIDTDPLERILICFRFGFEQTGFVTVENRVEDCAETEPPLFLTPGPVHRIR